jgi:hypothetical protein
VAAPISSSILIRITWALLMVCVRMLLVVGRTVWRLPASPWIKVGVLLGFVLVFFYRPAIAYYWFWGSVIYELAMIAYSIVSAILFGDRDSLKAWLDRKK